MNRNVGVLLNFSRNEIKEESVGKRKPEPT